MCVHTKVAINAAAICLSTNRTNTINILRAKCRHDIIVVDTMDYLHLIFPPKRLYKRDGVALLAIAPYCLLSF